MRKVLMGIMAAALLVFGMAMPAGATTAEVVTHPTCESWVTTDLASLLDPDDNAYILLESNLVVKVVDFCVLFGGNADIEQAKPAAERDMFAALADPVVHTFVWYDGETYNYTATDMGYQGYFEQWHAQGLM